MAETLSYATDRIDVERGPGMVRVTLPASAMWREAVRLSIGLAMCLTGEGFAIWMVVMAIRPDADIQSLILVIGGSTAAWSFVVGAVALARQLVRLPKQERFPTVIEATPAGLLISTDRHAMPEEIHYPASRMVGFGVFAGPLSFTLRRPARLVMRVRSDDPLVGLTTVVMEFDSPDPGLCDRLDEPMRQVLGLEPSAAAVAGRFRWEMIDRRL